MKNRKALIGIIVLAVLCIAGYVGVSQVEKKVEASTRDSLQAVGASVEKVSYSFFSKKLELGGIQFSYSFLGQKQDGRIRQVIITDPDMKAFDPATPGRPLVAKSIVIKGVEEKAEGLGIAGQPSMVSTATFEEVSLENWRQNLGKAIEEYKKAPWSEAFFAACLDYSIDSFAYKGVKGQFKQGSLAGNWAVERAAGKNAHDDLFSLSSEAMTFTSGDANLTVKGRVARCSVTDARIPSPKFLAAIMELAPALTKAQEDPQSPEAQAAALRLEPLLKTYFASTPYKNLTVEDVVLTQVTGGKEEPVCTFKSYSNSLNFSFPYNFEMGIQDLFIANFFPMMAADPSLGDVSDLIDLGLKDLTFSADFKLRSPAAPELATLGLDIRIKDLGGLASSVAAQLPLGGDLAKLATMDPDKWVSGVTIGKSRIAYTDDGLIARRLAVMSDETEVAPAELLPALNTQIQTEMAGVPVPGLGAAVAEMLDKPGTLTLSMSPAKPMALQALLGALLISPASLGLEVKTTQGAKSLLEQVTALQAAAEAAQAADEEAPAAQAAPASPAAPTAPAAPAAPAQGK